MQVHAGAHRITSLTSVWPQHAASPTSQALAGQ
jgi:hypothetical protein